jgi:hypothetical protein
MNEPQGKAIAFRWIFTHAAGMFLGSWILLPLPRSRMLEFPTFELICAAFGLQVALTQVAALRWIQAPLPLLPWGLTTMAGAAVGFDLAVRTLFLVFVAGMGMQSSSTLVVLATPGWILTHALIFSLAQAVLVIRLTDRRTAIHWGAWTLVACVVAWLPQAFGLGSYLGWKDLDVWIRGPLELAIYGILLSGVTVPALRRLLAARTISR